MKKLILFSIVLLGLSSFAEVFAMKEIKRLIELPQKNKDLTEAIKKNDLITAKKAIKSGADVNKQERIFLAIKKENLPMVQLLVENGAELKTKKFPLGEYFSYTPLSYAAKYGTLKIVKFLIEKGGLFDIEKIVQDRDLLPDSPLFQAIFNRNFEIAEFLEKKGAKLNKREKTRLAKLAGVKARLKQFEQWKKFRKKKDKDSTERQEFLYKKSKKKKEKILKPFIIKIDGQEVAVPGKGFLQ